MSKSIKISTKKRDEKAKAVQMDVCFEQRDQQIRKYESRNPFSMHEWIAAFKCGWLRQHGLGYWSFPSPPAHYRRTYEQSDEKYFVQRRNEAKRKQKKFLKALRESKK